MRKVFLTATVLSAMLMIMVSAAPQARAMTTPLPAGIAGAVADVNAVEKVRLVCRRVCDWRGCWRRCWNTAPRYYGYYPYAGYHGGYLRPYRWHRQWRHW